jgi:hypothetical protein
VAFPFAMARVRIVAFDVSTMITIQGVATRTQGSNPHARFWVDGKNDDGIASNWEYLAGKGRVSGGSCINANDSGRPGHEFPPRLGPSGKYKVALPLASDRFGAATLTSREFGPYLRLKRFVRATHNLAKAHPGHNLTPRELFLQETPRRQETDARQGVLWALHK